MKVISNPYAISKIYNDRKSDITSNQERNPFKGVKGTGYAVSYNEELKLSTVIGKCLVWYKSTPEISESRARPFQNPMNLKIRYSREPRKRTADNPALRKVP